MKRLFRTVLLVLALVVAPPSALAMVDLNTADVAELQRLKGIGPVKARAIVEERSANGPFLSIEDLARVRGIGPKLVERLRERATVSQLRRPPPRLR